MIEIHLLDKILDIEIASISSGIHSQYRLLHLCMWHDDIVKWFVTNFHFNKLCGIIQHSRRNKLLSKHSLRNDCRSHKIDKKKEIASFSEFVCWTSNKDFLVIILTLFKIL